MDMMRISVAARTDKAGRSANQDSLLVSADVANILTPNPDAVNKDNWIPLGQKGALLVVADGMGGASSGEIASGTVVQSLRKTFSAVETDVLSSETAMLQFMKQALVIADREIKVYAASHPESHGMGSTTVMVWLYAGKALCAWVGDSRIYRYGRNGLQRLSHDHSYVQQLVDAGAITQEQAFSHPNGNVITRAMGDTGKAVEPDVKAVVLNPDDMLLLCSDGLSGLLPDRMIQAVIAAHIGTNKPSDVLNGLWTKGEATGWTDNATIVVAMTAGQEEQPVQEAVILPSVPTPTPAPAPVPAPTVAPVPAPAHPKASSPATPRVAAPAHPKAHAKAPAHVPPKAHPHAKAASMKTEEEPKSKPVVTEAEAPSKKWYNKPAFLLPMWVWCIVGCMLSVVIVLTIIYNTSNTSSKDIEDWQNNTYQTTPLDSYDDDDSSEHDYRQVTDSHDEEREQPQKAVSTSEPKKQPESEKKDTTGKQPGTKTTQGAKTQPPVTNQEGKAGTKTDEGKQHNSDPNKWERSEEPNKHR